MIKVSSIILLIMAVTILTSNNSFTFAMEPIMDYKYSLEEHRIKRAKFIWEASLTEMVKANDLSTEDMKSVKNYLKDYIKQSKSEESRYEVERKALSVYRVEDLVKNHILDEIQGNKLKKKLNKYDLSDLE